MLSATQAWAVYRFAITPLGFKADFGCRHNVYPYLQTNEGIIASTEPIPINVTGATGIKLLNRPGRRHPHQAGFSILK